MIDVNYGAGRAEVSLSGDITEALVLELVAAVRRLAEECFYDEVLLEITSNGGSTHALRLFADAMDGYRRDGVLVATRALSTAESAAAVMLSLGAWRSAAHGARLLYHSSRTGELESVTSSRAAVLHGHLAVIDDWVMGRLANRALRAGGGATAAASEAEASMAPVDWPVVCALLGKDRGSAAKLVADAKARAGALGRLRRKVAAGAKGNGDGLRRLYEALFALDSPMSPALAKELRLIDEVTGMDAARPRPSPAKDAFRVPEWRAAFAPDGDVGRAVLCRHVLVLGETGSGKTASGVLPAVGAMFDRGNAFGCALVVDPKREVGPVLERLAKSEGARVRAFSPTPGPGGPTLNLMAGPDWSLDGDMKAGRFLTAAHRILVRAASLVGGSHPGGTLAGKSTGSREEYWPAEGARLGKTALALALMLVARRREVFAGLDSAVPSRSRDAFAALRRFARLAGFAPPCADLAAVADEARRAELPPRPAEAGDEDGIDGDDELEDSSERLREWMSGAARDLIERFVRKAEKSRLMRRHSDVRADLRRIAEDALGDPSMGALRRAADQLDLACLRCPDDAGLLPSPSVASLAHHVMLSLFHLSGHDDLAAGAVADALRPIVRSEEERELLNQIEGYWMPLAEGGHAQYTGVLTFGQQCFWQLSDPLPAWTLYFGVEPKGAGAAADAFNFGDAVDDQDGRTVFLAQPGLGAAKDALLAKALKALFFEAVLGSAKRRSRGGKMPLVGYVADECHRFITSDEAHGEQSFLDTCRSFGAFCVLACQSASSMEHALAEGGGSPDANRAALSVLLNNTATKLVFRSTDDATRDRLTSLCPTPTSGPKVVDVRPPSTLRPGECYAVTADGRFERRQLEAFDLEQAARRLNGERKSGPARQAASRRAGRR